MKKRIISSLLAIGFAGSGLGTGFNIIQAKAKPYTINVTIPVLASSPKDLQKVVKEANKIILKKINANIVVKSESISNLSNAYALDASSGKKSDLIMMVPGSYLMPAFAGNKMIMPVDSLVAKYGQNIKKGLGSLLKVGKYKGKQYAIPMKDPNDNGSGVWFLNDIAKKYHINADSLKAYKDLDKVFEKVHKGEPNMQIFFPENTTHYFVPVDNLGDSFGVLMNNGLSNTKVVNLYETKEFMDMARKMREWYLKGYISKDIATTQDSGVNLINAKKLFMMPTSYDFRKFGLAEAVSKDSVMFSSPVRMTATSQTFLWAVPARCKNPQKVIEFLNLLFKDAKLATLLRYGIQGQHYVNMSKNTIDTSKGALSYSYYWPIWGDSANYPLVKTELAGACGGSETTYLNKESVWKKGVKESKAFGFVFDTTTVKTEMTALNACSSQFLKLIETGSVDPVKTTKEFNAKLKAAGLEKVIKEKQRQLNAWLKEQ